MNELNTFYFTYVCVVVTHDTCFTRKKPGNFLSWLTSLIAYFYFNSKISILDINLYKSSDASKKSEGCQCVCLIFSFPNIPVDLYSTLKTKSKYSSCLYKYILPNFDSPTNTSSSMVNSKSNCEVLV